MPTAPLTPIIWRLGTCPFCNQGTVGFHLASDQKTMVMLCDECDAVWLDPERMELNALIWPDRGAAYFVSEISLSLAHPLARWATRAEVEQYGWGQLITGEGLTRAPNARPAEG